MLHGRFQAAKIRGVRTLMLTMIRHQSLYFVPKGRLALAAAYTLETLKPPTSLGTHITYTMSSIVMLLYLDDGCVGNGLL